MATSTEMDYCRFLNRTSKGIPGSWLRGSRANIQIRLNVLTVEDSLQRATGFFNLGIDISIILKIRFQHHKWRSRAFSSTSTGRNSAASALSAASAPATCLTVEKKQASGRPAISRNLIKIIKN
jgi:hypothetical protein